VKVLVGIVQGFFSGFLVYMILFLLFFDTVIQRSGFAFGFVMITFLGGWALSAFLLIRGARSVSKVFSRGLAPSPYEAQHGPHHEARYEAPPLLPR
jgi:hypothetical protein